MKLLFIERQGFRFIVLDASTPRLGEKQQACRVILKQQAPACGHASGFWSWTPRR